MLEDVKNNGEQPETLDIHAVETGKEEGSTEGEGSPLGKFKSSDALLEAYNELQSEFTRKCQKLSDTEKKLQEKSIVDTGKDNIDTKSEFAWQNKISEFLQSHKNASDLVDDISNEIMNDANLRESEDGLEKAYSRVVEKKYVPQEQLANNDEFLEKFIYSNNKIKEKIINEYIASLQLPKSPINLSRTGVSGGIATNNKFNSLAEANKYVENMFKF